MKLTLDDRGDLGEGSLEVILSGIRKSFVAFDDFVSGLAEFSEVWLFTGLGFESLELGDGLKRFS